MGSLYTAVKELALSLPDGHTDSTMECPKCKSNKAFSLTRDGNKLKFICFRASCGFKGIIDSRTGQSIRDISEEDYKPVKLFTGELDFLNDDEIAYLAGLFRIHPDLLLKIRWGVCDKRVYFPQYGVGGKVHGYIARYYPALNFDIPLKGAKAYWKPVIATPPPLLFSDLSVVPMIRKQKRVVIVEDYPSCLRIISQLKLPCCCLGGTNLYDNVIQSMMDLEIEQLIVVLDADAVHKAVKMKRATALLFDIEVIALTGKDPKDMTEDELTLVFQHIKSNHNEK
jgi:hypothetical protein